MKCVRDAVAVARSTFVISSAAFLAPAVAQTVGIGTSMAGALIQISTGDASVASRHAGVNMRTQPMAGTQQYIRRDPRAYGRPCG